MSTAIANQMFLAFLGRPADAAWLSSTAALLNGNQPSTALQGAFYNAAISEGVFSATDSTSALVNKIFLQTFGFGANTYEQTAWSNLVANGAVTKETLAWTIFKSYLGATNVPDGNQRNGRRRCYQRRHDDSRSRYGDGEQRDERQWRYRSEHFRNGRHDDRHHSDPEQ
jgi:hypothetical protein